MRVLLVALILAISSPLWAGGDIYVATTGSDSNTGAIGSPLATITHAIAHVTDGNGGWNIILRGGTYNQESIYIPYDTKNGVGWGEGQYNSIRSYPGEWAIINGGNNDATAIFEIGDTNGNAAWAGGTTRNVQYWLFERFEVTGGQNGFYGLGGPNKFRYLYIHDNKVATEDGLKAGIFLGQPNGNIIEYCYLKDNEEPGGPSGNNGNIIMDSDQMHTGSGEGGTFTPTQCNKKNIIRYNYVSGSIFGYRDKGDQRYGQASRNPDPAGAGLGAYKDYGNTLHHNIFVGCTNVTPSCDGVQFYNNILDGAWLEVHRATNSTVLYLHCIYNNTIIGTRGMTEPSNFTESLAAGKYNYYDNEAHTTHVYHPWSWYYNNIIDGTQTSVGDLIAPILVGNDMPANGGSGTTFSAENLTIDRNLIRNNSSSTTDIYVGRDTIDDPSDDCDLSTHTAAHFDGCSDTWRSLSAGTVKNWDNDNTLWAGASGASKYTPSSGSFVCGDSVYTIASGGIGGSHPYLTSVTIPSYIGATNPSDDAWVAGVLGLATYTNLRDATNGSDPSWIEGSTPAPAPPTLSNVTISGGSFR